MVIGRYALFAAALLAAAGCKNAKDGAGQANEPGEERAAAGPTASGPLAGRRQLLVIKTDSWSAREGTLELWRVAERGAWSRDDVWRVTLGPAGLGWGIGLHGQAAPAGLSGPTKREGDGRSPAGLFSIGAAFGYDARAKTRLPYTQVDGSWRCIDDPDSEHYGRILSADRVEADWSSAERMRRPDPLYRWVITVGHNEKRAPERGSCIFFHPWSGPEDATAGCAAMPAKRMRSLLGWLDPESEPAVAILPESAYTRLRPRWSLP